MKNVGKQFEEDFKKSCNKVDNTMLYYYRLKDSATGFSGDNNNLRFSIKNPYDVLIFYKKHLYCLELKSIKGKSLSFEKEKGDKGVIHYHQIKGLLDADMVVGITAGLLINFRDLDETWFIDVHSLSKFINTTDKKSFNYDDMKNKMWCYKLNSSQKRIHYEYNIEDLLENIK